MGSENTRDEAYNDASQGVKDTVDVTHKGTAKAKKISNNIKRDNNQINQRNGNNHFDKKANNEKYYSNQNGRNSNVSSQTKKPYTNGFASRNPSASKMASRKKTNASRAARGSINNSIKRMPKRAKNSAKLAAKEIAKAISRKFISKIYSTLGTIKLVFFFLCCIIAINLPVMISNEVASREWNLAAAEKVGKYCGSIADEDFINIINNGSEVMNNPITIDSIGNIFDIYLSYTRFKNMEMVSLISILVDEGSVFVSNLAANMKDAYLDKRYGETTIVKVDDESVMLTTDEKDALRNAQDYDEIIRIYCSATDKFFTKSYEEAVEKVTNKAKKNSKIDIEKTKEEIEQQGSPYTTLNYAGIMAAYSTTEDSTTGSMVRYKAYLKDASKKFVNYQVEETEYDKITPYKTYQYEERTLKVKATDYYNSCGDGSSEVMEAQIASINREISYLENEISLKKNIKKNKKKIDNLRNELTDLSEGKKEATVSRIKYIGSEKIDKAVLDVVLYVQVLDDNEEPIIDEEINDIEGKEVYLYQRYVEVDNETYYLKDNETTLVKPICETSSYYVINWECMSTEVDSVLEMFGIDDPDKVSIVRLPLDYTEDEIYIKAEEKYRKENGIKANKKLKEKQIDDVLLIAREYDPSSYITYREDYTQYFETLKNKIQELDITTTVEAIGTYGDVLSEKQINDYLKIAKKTDKEVSKNRLQFIKIGLALCGKVPYCNVSGCNRYDKYGINPKWGRPSGNEKHPQIGLDCSGFVSWTARNAFCNKDGTNPDEVYKKLSSCGDITSRTCKKINKSELKPGDLGCKFVGYSSGNNWNHVGIYIGKDSNGNSLWVHCNSSKNTVSITSGDCGFKVYFRMTLKKLEKDNYWKEETIPKELNISIDNSQGINEGEYVVKNSEKPTDKNMIDVVAITLYRESTDSEGFIACAEASQNYANYKKSNIYKALTNQLPGGENYSSAYTEMYVKKTKEKKVPPALYYKSLDNVLNGKYKYFPPLKYKGLVMYWVAKTNPDPKWNSKISKACEIGGNKFYYIPGEGGTLNK